MTKEQKLIARKLSMLDLADHLKNVSQACRVMRVSRDTFYRVKNAYIEGGVDALVEKTRRKPNYKNRVAPEVEEAILDYSIEHPSHGQKYVSQELRKKDVWISEGGIRSIWLRHDMETMQKRLKKLEEKVKTEGIELTPEQIEALSRLKDEEQSHGEIETEYPGYLLSQDTYFVGTLNEMKGVGRIYLQSVIDTYCRVGFGKLYTSKLPVTSADILNDKVLPFFDQECVMVHRILTDRGTEFKGRIDTHPYEIFLALDGIEHTYTKARHPQTNGICERFHKTLQQEFFSITFRKKLYTSVEELQKDLDEYLDHYNNERPH